MYDVGKKSAHSVLVVLVVPSECQPLGASKTSVHNAERIKNRRNEQASGSAGSTTVSKPCKRVSLTIGRTRYCEEISEFEAYAGNN